MNRFASSGLLLAAVTIVLGALGPAPALAAPTPTAVPPATTAPAASASATPTASTKLAPLKAAVATPTPTPTPAATATPTPQTTGEQAMAAKAASDAAVLGAPTGPLECGLTGGGGCRQQYQLATLLWSPDTGAYWTRGAIRDRWNRNAAQDGFLGYPTSDEFCGLAGNGCGQHFTGGDVYWSPATDAHFLTGEILAKWNSTGAQKEFLAYPTSDQFCGLAGNGCGQHFQGGEIYSSPASGTHFVRGAIRGRWTDNNWENGFLGYPTSDEFCGLAGGGCGQHYQGGEIYWSPTTDAHFVRGAIRGTWTGNGSEAGFLGYPISDEFCGLAGGGCGQHYQGGEIYWTPGLDAHFVRGAIRGVWTGNNWENGFLGYPTSDEFCGLAQGGCGQHYQGGEIYWSPATDAHFVRGAIREVWTGRGWENGPLGYPTSDEHCSSSSSCASRGCQMVCVREGALV
ncbi:hypothetical protein [Raineyella sp. W15-4]|uniref:hypothetical protein n=1 Tax=Raineyella sp. W15-4 TaxID=3081651 RepID=UPI002952D668|nr:hypothetical protein [Raineyella sp. W15-4]WOQ16459.1 hypothetical protein R0145_14825 [Raineyella sp. W15-4]